MIALVSAPSNLGLRPPERGAVPGTHKAPEALREAGLFDDLLRAGARDAGVVLPGRYVDDDPVRPPGHVRNERALVEHARRLADRLAVLLDGGAAPLVLGGDCSLLIAAGLAVAGRGGAGLVHIDGHTDFRHPGNSDECASVAGEDLAAAIGLHWDAIADIDGLRPYFAPERAVHIGHRHDDEAVDEVTERIGLVVSAADAAAEDPARLAERVREVAGPAYWLQIDVDVLDPQVMPAVDSPDPGGLRVEELVAVLERLAPDAVGASVTVFDPDLDPDGRYARTVADVVVRGLGRLGTAAIVPPGPA
ncbi:arginase family protein [Tsukamurella sp. 1534]|uniref:arginase family protein n=1 Tax=Tsukamurella sp. 1534 TaxID=1151061 RepID=UPI0002F734D8|nr:arginase family protein [Tsukamurella sp. 1534]